MLPENILQSDMLDIIFENRNKAYGAYHLRKNYSQRLKVALASMAGFVLVFSFLQLEIKPANKNIAAPVIDSLEVTPVQIAREKIIKPLVKIIPKKQKQFAAIKDPVPLIAKDNVKDTVPTNDDLNNARIGSQTIKGDPSITTQVIAPSIGNGNIVDQKSAEPKVVEIAEIMPQFPGGLDALRNFLMKNIKQPDDLNADETLVAKAKFVVGIDGNILGIEILQSARKDLDADVLRVLHKMPKWIPGMQNGKNVAVYFQLPVTFVGTEQ